MRRADLGSVAAGVLFIIVATPAPAQQVVEQEAITFTDTVPQARLLAMIEQGSRLFNGGSCVFCHSVGGYGGGGRAPNLTDEEWLHSIGTIEGIDQTIRWGVKQSEMKAMAPRPFQMNPSGGMTLSRADRFRVAAYVWSRANGPAPPGVRAQDGLLALLRAGDTDEALDRLRADARARPDSLMFSESTVNRLGYEYLQLRESPETATELFLFNTKAHPESWNTWDSLGEGYAALGETQKAIEMYEKALELNPGNTSSTQALERLRSP